MKYFSLGLTAMCVIAVTISMISIFKIQETNQEVVDYNHILLGSLSDYQITITNQAFTLKIQAENLEQLTTEKEKITKIAIDLRTENFDLRYNIGVADEGMEILMEEIEDYQQQLGIVTEHDVIDLLNDILEPEELE